MEPKFQSSFIPKGPAPTTVMGGKQVSKIREHGLVSFLAMLVFVLTLTLSLGVFGYKMFLKYSISNMEEKLEEARTALAAEPVEEFVDLNSRILSTGEIVGSHVMLSPLFDFLEASTVRLLRFTGLGFSSVDNKLELSMTGSAPSYAVIALQSDIFNKSRYFRDATFSNLDLDERGSVTFSFRAIVDPNLLSYTRYIESLAPAPVGSTLPVEVEPVASTTEPTTQ